MDGLVWYGMMRAGSWIWIRLGREKMFDFALGRDSLSAVWAASCLSCSWFER